jgi:hypothetical protein
MPLAKPHETKVETRAGYSSGSLTTAGRNGRERPSALQKIRGAPDLNAGNRCNLSESCHSPPVDGGVCVVGPETLLAVADRLIEWDGESSSRSSVGAAASPLAAQ